MSYEIDCVHFDGDGTLHVLLLSYVLSRRRLCLNHFDIIIIDWIIKSY
jgi:hypothetical protein